MKRFIAETVCFYLLACVLLICSFSDDSESKIKNAEINDIVFTIKKYYPDVDSAINILQGYETDYIVIGEDGKDFPPLLIGFLFLPFSINQFFPHNIKTF